MYLIDWGTEFLLLKEMIDEWKLLDNRILDYFIKPTKIIHAEKGILDEIWKENIDKIPVECEFVTIKNAGHCFDEEGTELKLFEETLNWFEK